MNPSRRTEIRSFAQEASGAAGRPADSRAARSSGPAVRIAAVTRRGFAALAGLAVLAAATAALADAAPATLPAPLEPGEAWLKSHLDAAARRFDGNRTSRVDARFDLGAVVLELAPDLGDGSLVGHVETTVRSLVDGLGDVLLELDAPLVVTAVGLDATGWLHGGGELRLFLAQPLDSGQTATVSVDYEGNPTNGGFGSWALGSHGGVPILSTLSEPSGASSWWPCKDAPDDKADSAEVRVRVPLGVVATSNGTLAAVDTLGEELLWTWKTRHPIATYLVSLTATNFVRIDDSYVPLAGGRTMPVTHFVYPEDLADALVDFSLTPAMIGFFASAWGEYPFVDEKYGHSEFSWGGAMEHQCNTSYGSSLIRGDHAYDRIVAHELTHQWWGDLVTCATWADIWLNEGFATYGEALWTEHVGGPGALVPFMNSRCAVSDPSGPVYDPPSTFDSNTVYKKGAWLVHMLRGQVGDEAFFQLLRDWGNGPFRHGSATVADFVAHCEAYAPRDLDGFWQGFLHGLNRPRYAWQWTARELDGLAVLDLRAAQTQTTWQLFDLWMPVRATTAAGAVDAWLRLPEEGAAHALPLPAAATGAAFDPDDWMLEAHVAGDLGGRFQLLAGRARGVDGQPLAAGEARAALAWPGGGLADTSLCAEGGLLAWDLGRALPGWTPGEALELEVLAVAGPAAGQRGSWSLLPDGADWQPLGGLLLQAPPAAPVLSISMVAGGLELAWNPVDGGAATRVESSATAGFAAFDTLGTTTGFAWPLGAPAGGARFYRAIALPEVPVP